MSATETITKAAETIGLPVEKGESKPRWHSSLKEPNLNYVPPKDFKVPGNTVAVPLNPKGPTELPQTLNVDYTNYEFEDFLPYITLTEEPALEPYTHVDPGSRADPEKKSLFSVVKEKKNMTPSIGTEVKGVQLSSLNDQQKDELALWAAERGVLVFRDQDFVHQTPEWLKEYGSYFGRLHVHTFGHHIKGHPEILSNLRDTDKTVFDNYSAGQLTTTRWHSDMTYEKNPMGTTFLCALEVPEDGGDTLYLNSMDAFDKLSPTMQNILEGLSAVHSGAEQQTHGVKTSVYRRPLVETVHPIVRKHPVTGRKILWFPPEYVTQIVGLKKEENNAIKQMLFDHLGRSLDFHTRVKWEKGTVVVYDNRAVLHSVVLDYALTDGARRHHIRLTPQAEVPIPARAN